MKNLFLVLISCLLTVTVPAHTITGIWNGQLKVQTISLTIVLHIATAGDGLKATMDSPDQGAFGIPVSKIDFKDPNVTIEIGGGAIRINGVFQNDSTINCTFKQNGSTFPLTLHLGEAPKAARPQEPTPPFPYRSDSVTFHNNAADIDLSGTLTFPQGTGPFPAVVLISGSDPQNRDEEILGHKPFWVIADYLSRRGIAVLRYDDRGTGASTGVFSGATTADFATDASAAVTYLKSQNDIDSKKIGLIGHSEGGIIAAMLASEDSTIACVVLLAAPGEDGARLLIMQNEALAKASGLDSNAIAALTAKNKKVFDILTGNDNPEKREKALTAEINRDLPAQMKQEERQEMARQKLRALTNPWMMYFLKNDPQVYLKEIKCPVLAMGGSHDLQVPADINLQAIASALSSGGNTQTTIRQFQGLNHLFQTSKTGLPAEYGKIEETFAPQVLKYMGDWLRKELFHP